MTNHEGHHALETAVHQASRVRDRHEEGTFEGQIKGQGDVAKPSHGRLSGIVLTFERRKLDVLFRFCTLLTVEQDAVYVMIFRYDTIFLCIVSILRCNASRVEITLRMRQRVLCAHVFFWTGAPSAFFLKRKAVVGSELWVPKPSIGTLTV